MDNNTNTNTTTINIDAATGWHLDSAGILLHRNVLINQLRAAGHAGSVSISVPDLRTLHATTLAAFKPVAKAKTVKPAAEPVDRDSDEFKRSLKNLKRAAARAAAKAAKTTAAA